MILASPKFAESSSSGISSLGINLKAFIFQLITFVIVLLILRRFALPKIVKTLEDRRRALEKSLTDAKQIEETLAKAEASAKDILSTARQQADAALAEARKATRDNIAAAETKAAERAALIIKDAEASLGEEREKLRQDLRQELAVLVADATENIIGEKLDPKRDMSLIERALKGVGR